MPIGSTVVYNSGDLILSTVSSSGVTFQENKIAAATSSIILFNSNGLISSQSLNSTTVGTSSYFSGSNIIVSNLTASNISASGTGSFNRVGIGTTNPTNTLEVVGNISASSFTGSVFGTSSWATNSLTAALATSINFTASNATFALTASSLITASSYAINNLTASNISCSGYLQSAAAAYQQITSSTFDSASYSNQWVRIAKFDYNLPGTIPFGGYFNEFALKITANPSAGMSYYNDRFVSPPVPITGSNKGNYANLLITNASYGPLPAINVLNAWSYNTPLVTKIRSAKDSGNATWYVDVFVTNQSASAVDLMRVEIDSGRGQLQWQLNPSTASYTSSVEFDITIPGVKNANTYVYNFDGNVTSSGNILVGGRVGVGTTNPSNPLGINGAASFGSYASTTAPANGIIVSGNVGIGTSTVVNKLDVAGNISCSVITASLFSGSLSGSVFGTSSWATNALTASSLITTNSYQIVNLTASNISASSFTGSFSGSINNAVSASFANTASSLVVGNNYTVTNLTSTGTATFATASFTGDLTIPHFDSGTLSGGWVQIDELLQGSTYTGYSERMIVNVYGGFYHESGMTQYIIKARGGISVYKSDVNGGVAGHTLKIYQTGSSAATASADCFLIGIRMTSGSYYSVQGTAYETQNGKYCKWTTTTETGSGVWTDTNFTSSTFYNDSTSSWATNSLTASSLVQSNSYRITNLTASNISASSFTGSVFGTSSWSTNSLTASSISTTGNAFVQGGNSFGTTATIGTNDANSLVLETNSTAQLTINSGGRIGIGVGFYSPYKLYISDTHVGSLGSASIFTSTTQNQNTANSGNDTGIYNSYVVANFTSSNVIQNQAVYNTLEINGSGSFSGSYRAARHGLLLSNTASLDVNGSLYNTYFTNQISPGIPNFNIPTWYLGTSISSDLIAGNTTGSIGSTYGHYLGTPFSTGAGGITVTSSYGIYIERQKTANVVTNGYGIYQAYTGDLNIFAGKTRIGSTTAPINTLDVTGNISASTITASLFFGTSSVANALNTANSYQIANLTASNISASTITASNVIVNGNLTVTGSIFASLFSASNIYITSSTLVVTDNIITINALSPYQRYAGLEMYDSGSGTLSSFLWDSINNYFFVSSSDAGASRQIILGPTGESSLTANYIPLISGSNNITSSVIYQSGSNIGIGTTTPLSKFVVNGGTVNTSSYTTSESRIADGSIHLMKTVAGGVFESIRAMNMDTTAGTTVRVLAASTSDPFNNGNGGKVFIDAIRTSTNMDLAFSLNDVAGAAAVERVRFMGSGNVGIGSTSPVNKLDVVGNISCSAITASLFFGTASVANALNSANSYTVNTLTASNQIIYKNAVLLDYSSSALATSQSNYVVLQNLTGSYNGAFFDYFASSASNFRAGTVIAGWSGSNITYTEYATTDVGTTNQLTMSAAISASYIRLLGNAASSLNWNIKSSGRYL